MAVDVVIRSFCFAPSSCTEIFFGSLARSLALLLSLASWTTYTQWQRSHTWRTKQYYCTFFLQFVCLTLNAFLSLFRFALSLCAFLYTNIQRKCLFLRLYVSVCIHILQYSPKMYSRTLSRITEYVDADADDEFFLFRDHSFCTVFIPLFLLKTLYNSKEKPIFATHSVWIAPILFLFLSRICKNHISSSSSSSTLWSLLLSFELRMRARAHSARSIFLTLSLDSCYFCLWFCVFLSWMR